MTKMKITRLKLTPLAKQFNLCFGSKVNSARALRYSHKGSIYSIIAGKTKRPHIKKLLAGREAHLKDIDKLFEMLGVKI